MSSILGIVAGAQVRLPNNGPRATVVRWYIQRGGKSAPELQPERVCELDIEGGGKVAFGERFMRLVTPL